MQPRGTAQNEHSSLFLDFCFVKSYTCGGERGGSGGCLKWSKLVGPCRTRAVPVCNAMRSRLAPIVCGLGCSRCGGGANVEYGERGDSFFVQNLLYY